MSVPTRDDLMALLNVQSGHCVSIYMCTDRMGSDSQQNPIRLRKLLREAEDRLGAAGMRASEARDLLAPGNDLLNDSYLWRHMSDGMVLFLAKDFVREYRVPLNFDEEVVVNRRFHVKPLVPLMVGDGNFLVLALSQGGVRLFRGSRFNISPVELEDVPANLRESMHLDETGGSLQFHTAQQAGGAGSERAAMFYGTGMAELDQKRNIVNYFREVDKGLREALGNKQLPLVLAGVESLLPLYREANTYPNLIAAEVPVGSDGLGAQELHDKAWPLVEPIYSAARGKANDLLRQLLGAASPQAATDLREIVPAASFGRVDTLLALENARAWGNFDAQSGTVAVHDQQQPDDEDLIDLAVLQTLSNGGTVYNMRPGELPDGVFAAGLLRY